MTRRSLLKRAAYGVAVSTALSASRVLGANERINVALIGCGGRGKMVAKLMREVEGVNFGAVCDVYDVNAGVARDWAGSGGSRFPAANGSPVASPERSRQWPFTTRQKTKSVAMNPPAAPAPVLAFTCAPTGVASPICSRPGDTSLPTKGVSS